MWPFSSSFSSSRAGSTSTSTSSSSSPPSPTPNPASSTPGPASAPTQGSPPALLLSSPEPSPAPLPPPAFHPESMRIPLTALGLGFVSGCFTSASRASRVFMAENAHRQPDTVQGWYFYNKTKNYKVLLAGAKGGAGTALKLGAWATSWVALDHAVGVCRRSILFGPAPAPTFVQTAVGRRRGDAGNGDREVNTETRIALAYHPQDRYMRSFDGAFAGMGIASGAVLLHRLPRPTSYHFILGGLLAGGLAGALRDVQGLIAEANIRAEDDQSRTSQAASSTSWTSSAPLTVDLPLSRQAASAAPSIPILNSGR
ncbi:hypothetical protein OC834_003912 [Tilletia horrida]|uniref:Uncharacterized protein n=1 Tax=Tilletia horrida TaxID=155126 RepID=A0AAN6GC39_9BASI|nr:hypothetical protein OC834_003912 [Tilletia horrida]KAK0532693.1 hypothetical protein OC842_003210 [Tilletia horrida]